VSQTLKDSQPTTGIALIDRISDVFGSMVSWLTLLMVIVTFVIVMLRYFFDVGFIWMQESTTWMHAFVFMLGAAYTLRAGDHVRVDVFYKQMSVRRQAWVDILGTLLFLLPLCGYVFFESLFYVQQSWAAGESSREGSGLGALYLLKTVIPLTALMLALQGVSEIARAIRRMRQG
jgi:TRAP-type mannitol/chloroaromatic compound transport system permease small subunit